MKRVLSKRTWMWVGVIPVVFAVVANIQWMTLRRETRYEGGVHREYKVLGRFDHVSYVEGRSFKVKDQVAQKLGEYGLHRISGDGSITVEKPQMTYRMSKEDSGDIRRESSRLSKEMPWLKQVWNGARFTSLYARGNHPKLGGFVEVMCGRLPERKHGPGKLRFTISVTE